MSLVRVTLVIAKTSLEIYVRIKSARLQTREIIEITAITPPITKPEPLKHQIL